MGDDDDVTHGDDVGPEESTANIEWTVINSQTLPNIALPNVQRCKRDACERLIIS